MRLEEAPLGSRNILGEAGPPGHDRLADGHVGAVGMVVVAYVVPTMGLGTHGVLVEGPGRVLGPAARAPTDTRPNRAPLAAAGSLADVGT